MFCKKCGTENLDDARFCVSCGAKMEVGINLEKVEEGEIVQDNNVNRNFNNNNTYNNNFNSTPEIPTNFVYGIICSVCCCLPLGIISIVYAMQVNQKLLQGDVEGARKASDTAKLLGIIGIVVGVVVTILYIVAVAAGGLLGH